MRRILVLGLLLVHSLALPAQELSATDSAEVQQAALRHVRQFEGLLNLIAQPDKYFRKYSFIKLVQGFYQEESRYQIFRDSLVAVEDNLNPNAPPDADNFLPIKGYLEAFFSFYEKSPVASIFFSDYQVSPVKQGEFTYVEVFYRSDFTNRHRAYPDQPYPPRYNKATLRARRQEDGWQMLISNINFYEPESASDASVAQDQTPNTGPAYQAELLTLPQKETPPGGASPDATQSGVPLEELSRTLADSSSRNTWEVLDQLDRGSDYQLRVYDSVAILKPTERLALVESPVVTRSAPKESSSQAEAFKRFAPLIRQVGPSSVQVAFDNPADEPLSVELINDEQEVLFSEKVGGKQSYARAMNLENLEEDSYLVCVSNRNYEHAVRIRYQSTQFAEAQSNATQSNATQSDVTQPSPTSPDQERIDPFTNFRPYIMKKDNEMAAQVVFKNPSDDTLTVELLDTSGVVLYSEEVAGNQSYARAISMKNLYEGPYHIRVLHDDYRHAVRIYHQPVAER